jgi:hypothetical protein
VVDEEEDESTPQPQHDMSLVVHPHLTYFELRQQYLHDRIQKPNNVDEDDNNETRFHRIKFSSGSSRELDEVKQSLEMIREAIQMRSVYVDDGWWKGAMSMHQEKFDWEEEIPGKSNHQFKMEKGVMRVWAEVDEKFETQTKSSRRWRKKIQSETDLKIVNEDEIPGGKLKRTNSVEQKKSEPSSPRTPTGLRRSPSFSNVKPTGSGNSRPSDSRRDSRSLSPASRLTFRQSGKVISFNEDIPSVDQFYSDLDHLMHIVTNGPCKSLAFQRMQLLEDKFKIHCMLNMDLELRQQKLVPHRDFYNVRKVDNHVHHSACMNQKHLLRFIKKKLKTSGEVIFLY